MLSGKNPSLNFALRPAPAACKLAHRRLDELFEKFGAETMIEAIEQIFAETEMKCRRTIQSFPAGVYEAESFLDNDGVTKEPVRIHAKVTVDQETGDMTIDLSGCSEARKAGINSRTLAGARVAYKSLTAPLDPVNEGSFNALKHIIPEGSIMMARYPAPMAGWYPDPSGRHELRYWDGKGWTSHVRDGAVQGTDAG